MFCILVVVVVSQVFRTVQTHGIAQCKWIQFVYINNFSINLSLRKNCVRNPMMQTSKLKFLLIADE